MLMNPDMGTVDHHDIAVVASFGHRRQQLVPDPGRAPTLEAIVASRMRPIALGNVSPRRACVKSLENPAQHQALNRASRPLRNRVRQ